MELAPIALFAYNRLEHTSRTVEALAANDLAGESKLFVFSDGPRLQEDVPKVDAVRSYLETIRGFKSVTVIQQTHNLGLVKSIIGGVTEICQQHGLVIVVEDDLVTSHHFLSYMNEALALYESEPEVISIHGYVFPVNTVLPRTFFIKGADCWGWATWQRGWQIFNPDGRSLLAQLEARKLTSEFDFNRTYPYTSMLRQQIAGKVSSWAILWYASAFLQNKLTLYPGRSLVRNIGHDSSGTHDGSSTLFDVAPSAVPVRQHRIKPQEDRQARAAFERFFRSLRPSRMERYQMNIKTIIRNLCPPVLGIRAKS